MTEYNDECWCDLAKAVAKQAVLDWVYFKKKTLRPETTSLEAERELRSCEWFFRSSWCLMLTGLDGKTILRRAKQLFNVQ